MLFFFVLFLFLALRCEFTILIRCVYTLLTLKCLYDSRNVLLFYVLQQSSDSDDTTPWRMSQQKEQNIWHLQNLTHTCIAFSLLTVSHSKILLFSMHLTVQHADGHFAISTSSQDRSHLFRITHVYSCWIVNIKTINTFWKPSPLSS